MWFWVEDEEDLRGQILPLSMLYFSCCFLVSVEKFDQAKSHSAACDVLHQCELIPGLWLGVHLSSGHCAVLGAEALADWSRSHSVLEQRRRGSDGGWVGVSPKYRDYWKDARLAPASAGQIECEDQSTPLPGQAGPLQGPDMVFTDHNPCLSCLSQEADSVPTLGLWPVVYRGLVEQAADMPVCSLKGYLVLGTPPVVLRA